MRAIDRIQRGPFRIGLILLGLLLPIAGWAQSQKIGYVDMKRLLDNAPQVAAGRQRIEAEFAGRDRQLQAERTRLTELEAREARDAAVMPKAAAEALHREIQTLKRTIDRTIVKLNEDLKNRRDEEMNRRWPVINDALIEYSRENNFDLVLTAPVLYASPRIDITDEVLARLQARAESGGPR